MRKSLLKAVFAVSVVALMSSCDNNGSGKAPTFELRGDIVGNVKRYGVNQNIDIIMDNLDTVRTVNTQDLDPEMYPDATRVISHVYMNKRTVVGNHYVFNAMVDNIVPVPVKKVLDLSYVNSDPERVDSVGKDPIAVRDYIAIVTGYYLDVKYSYMYDSNERKKHNISFVVDDEKSDDSHLYIAMRHNADNDTEKELFNGFLSVDIREYLENAKDGKLRIEFVYYDGVIDQKHIIDWTRPDYMKR